MKKRIMLTLVCLLAAIGWVAAQNSPITGIVISNIYHSSTETATETFKKNSGWNITFQPLL